VNVPTFEKLPYWPAVTPVMIKFVFEIVPVKFEALRLESPYPFPEYASAYMDVAFTVCVFMFIELKLP
jgi:hypothetical protein